MPLDSNSQSNASIEQSVKLPDFFSCRNCKGWNWCGICEQLRDEGRCAKGMLAQALASGAVQIVLYTSAQLPGGVR